MTYWIINLLESIQHILYFQMEYIIVPCAIILWLLLRSKRFKSAIFLWVLFTIFLWARYVDPFWIKIKHTDINVWFTWNYVLISDLHLWQNKTQDFLNEVVEKINNLNDIDAILIAWDFMMEPDKDEIVNIYKPLSELKYPIYVVLWNHDVQKPWPPYRQELVQALTNNNVIVLNNQIEQLSNWTIIIWIGDKRWNEDDTAILNQFTVDNNIISLLHNPDSVLDYTNKNTDVTLAWHTHCGQIKIPWLRKSRFIIPVSGPYLCGYYQTPNTHLYITAWIWETSIPFRLFNRATIDIIHLE